MDFSKLFNLEYLFLPRNYEGFSLPFLIGLLAFFGLSIVWAIWSGMKKNKAGAVYKRAWGKWQIWGWTNGITGLLLVGFREANAIYLGSRIWLFLWLLIALIWLLTIIKFMIKDLPAQRKEREKEKEFQKWLPNSK